MAMGFYSPKTYNPPTIRTPISIPASSQAGGGPAIKIVNSFPGGSGTSWRGAMAKNWVKTAASGY